MTRYASFLNPAKVDQEGLLKYLNRLFGPGVATAFNANGWKVSQRGAGANMSVDIAVGDGLLNLPNGAYGFWGWTDTVENVVVTAANPTNPRVDVVVAYIDPTATSTSAANSPGALKFRVMAGTPSGTPAAMSDANIQSTLGAAVAWIKLATYTVATGSTTVVNANITDVRTGITLGAPIPDGSIDTRKLAASAVEAGNIAKGAIGGAAVVAYKEVSTIFNSGGAGAFSGAGIGSLNTSFAISKAGMYEVSILLPAVYSAATTTQWYIKVTSETNLTTFVENLNGGTGNIARPGEPTTFFVRRRMNLAAGTYPVIFQWFATVAGGGNPITCGCGPSQPATFTVKEV